MLEDKHIQHISWPTSRLNFLDELDSNNESIIDDLMDERSDSHFLTKRN